MKRFTILLPLLSLGATTPAADYRPDFTKNLGFPIYTNAPPGQKQLTGVYKATETPALAPLESEKKINVPKGFEVRLFASEPEVVNPVAMTWDERGRLWVVELYEYPKGAPKGTKGRDRIKILEDTDADGRADKVTVFADGYSLATGLALGNGGVYLGQAPHLYFLEDTDGDDKMDKQTIVKTGFGMEDRHELLNGFAWGPDGWLYMTHGVFTHSKVRDPDAHDPDGFGVQMDAALARFHPRTKKFEVFADGTSNPWGVDWNERGDAFVSACVIQHLFHMAPGGQYNRQGGTWANPYGYVGDLPSKGLPAIVDWRHFRAAHAGICIYQGDQWPAEWRGLVFLGNIHESALNCDRLTPVGSTYRAERETTLLGPRKGDYQMGGGTFLASDDRWFRPVAAHTGPDGAVWIADWCDKYPCYQNAQADPEGVDREMGRIWRVVWVGEEKGKKVASKPSKEMDLKKASSAELVKLLAHENNWQRRQAQREIGERRDSSASPSLLAMLKEGKSLDARLAALWALHNSELLTKAALDEYASDKELNIRAWVARLTAERLNTYGTDQDVPSKAAIAPSRLHRLSTDPDPVVRAAVATAFRQLRSGSLTVNTPPRMNISIQTDAFVELFTRPSIPGDFLYDHLVWMALEPMAAEFPANLLDITKGAENSSTAASIVRNTMRRICDLGDAAARTKHLNAAMEHLASLASKTTLAEAALDGLIDAFKSKGLPPTIPLEPIFQKLTANPKLADKARRLATLLGDTTASRALIAKINDAKASLEDRLKGITAARETKDDAARAELLRLFKGGPLSPALSPSEGEREKNAQALYVDGLRALGTFGGDDIAYVVTDAWKNFSLPTRRVASEVLVLRSKWSRALLAAVDRKIAKPEDISATARRALAQSSDATVVDHADRVLGKYRPPGADKLKRIADKRKIVLGGEPDLKNGYEVAKRTCYVCHKMYGEGADVGPDLTGVGRSTLDALLHNVIDPNEVIGNGNEATEVELKDGTSLTGRIVEDSPSRLKLLASGPTEHNIARSDIAMENGKPKIRTSQMSLMPEGLEVLSDKDFRDMIWFILNPPGDSKPWTKELRKELLGDENAGPGLKKSASAR